MVIQVWKVLDISSTAGVVEPGLLSTLYTADVSAQPPSSETGKVKRGVKGYSSNNYFKAQEFLESVGKGDKGGWG